jgi:hypothetical protein
MSFAPSAPKQATAERRPPPWWPRAERALACVLPVVMITVVVLPMVATHSAFGLDWPIHLWNLRHQGEFLVDNFHPTYFIHSEDGVFYPHFAFYGGTAYAAGAPLVLLFGDAGRNGYVVDWIVVVAAGYGAWVWLGRLAGLGLWAAQAPAAVFLTVPYYVSLLYTRGDWPEVAAVSAIPLLVAAIVSVLKHGRVTLGRGVALAIATIAFTGSHGQTLLWATTLAAVGVPLLLALDRRVRALVLSRAGLEVLGVMLPAAAVNGWFLLPALAYQAQTFIASPSAIAIWESTVSHTRELLPVPLFSLRPAAQGDLAVALPFTAMGWTVAVALLAGRRGWRSGWTRLLVVLAALTTLLVVLIVDGRLILLLPKTYVFIQYTYRLENYLLLTVAGGVLAGLVLVRQLHPRVRQGAYAALAIAITIAAAQAARHAGERPGGGQYSDYWAPQVEGLGNFSAYDLHEFTTAQRHTVTFPPRQIHDDRITVVAPVAPGELVDTNLVTMPQLLRIRGAHVAGFRQTQDGSDPRAARLKTVLRVDPHATPGRAVITVSGGTPPPVLLGRILSLLGVLGLAANLLLRRRRRSTPTS